jgi:murein DD-endopeptidase MepM/ murein hydrolase activator NlpD
MRRLLSALLLGLMATLAPYVAAGAQSSGPIYVVQQGDTLYDIAARFGVSLSELIAANSIANPSLVSPGMQLVIPGFGDVSGVLTTREVGYGENLTSLSLRYGSSEDALVKLNRLVNPGRIYIGEAVIVAQEEAKQEMPQANVVLVRENDTLLALAAQRGLNPWSLLQKSAHSYQAWLLPGELLFLPGEERATWALPEPILGMTVQPNAGQQGHTEDIHIRLATPLDVEGSLGEWTLNFHPWQTDEVVALQGVHAMADPGMYDLEISFSDPQSGEELYRFSQPLRVKSGGYRYDPVLMVPKETIDPAVTEPENARVNSFTTQVSDERLWDGVFQYPSTRTSAFPSLFGSRRNYNNTGYTAYHSGLDFYGAPGEPITAPAAGRVVMAEMLTVRGNTTIIDHGWGIFTAYLHQSEILVSVGDIVSPGQRIGLVGATGRVTGPHLHWEVWVGGIPVDPLEWVQTAFP